MLSTEANAGGKLACKSTSDIVIYKSLGFDSTFIEIINYKISNSVNDWIYRHPTVDLNELNNNWLNKM